MAPQAGLAPALQRLTAARATLSLLRNRMAGSQGFAPRLSGSEPGVLLLDDEPMVKWGQPSLRSLPGQE